MADSTPAAALEQSQSRLAVAFNSSEKGQDGVCRYEILIFDGQRQWSVARRYREFRNLHSSLSELSPPALPPKSLLLRSISEKFRHRRYAALENWLKDVVASHAEGLTPELEEFLYPEKLQEVASWTRKACLPTTCSILSDVSTTFSHIENSTTQDETVVGRGSSELLDEGSGARLLGSGLVDEGSGAQLSGSAISM